MGSGVQCRGGGMTWGQGYSVEVGAWHGAGGTV